MNSELQKTIKDIEEVRNKLQDELHPIYILTMQDAILILQDKGLPFSPTSYSLSYVHAVDKEDLKLKFILATLPSFKSYLNNEITLAHAHANITPLVKAYAKKMKEVASSNEVETYSIFVLDFDTATLDDVINVFFYCNENFKEEDKLIFCLDKAIDTLHKRGMPDPKTYSPSKIIATDYEDINLKLSLVIMTFLKAVMEGVITYNEGMVYWLPIYNAVFSHGEDSFPITVTVEAIQ